MRISLRRRVATAATALGLTTLGVLGAGAAPAQAAPADCPVGYFCGWKTYDATGTMYKTNASVATLGTWDNQFRTVSNRTSKFACLHDDANYGYDGNVGSVAPNPSGTEWGGPGSNGVSSVRLVATERECGGWEPYPYWYANPQATAPAFGDLNGDKTSDVLARDKAGRLWFLPGDGTGKLVGAGGWNAMNALTRHGDFSGDGKEDVIAREASTGKLWLYKGAATGSLGTRLLIGSGGWNAMNHLTAFGDLTGDGRSDLFAVEKSTGKLWLYPGTSTGALGARKLIGAGGWNSMNALVGFGDMTKDGKADLLARETSTGKLWLYPGKTGGLATRVLIGSGWNSMAAFLAVGDRTGDGYADMAAITNSSYSSNYGRGPGLLVAYDGKSTNGFQPGVMEDESWFDLNGQF
ncbi:MULTISPECIES: FG-GAP-like repeat-containing protein [Streptomyces]|uniref:FG-GAP-like repeat-containing protein n=2 Tax=Streptomyces TaxID=1883 RepID=A0ABU4KEF8_9ACTN|nr:FG-GAP-like repeat-containing protein [Streptomyces roseolus]MDX2295939.1 FG-GAP-like repeat-containing protein [Streptomyces roseolus]